MGNARLDSQWVGKEREAGKGLFACLWRTATAAVGAQPLAFSSCPSAPSCPYPANSRESDARPLWPTGGVRCGSFPSWTLSPRRRTPGEDANAARWIGACALVDGLWQSAPRCLGVLRLSGRKWASTPGCRGPAVRDGIAPRILPTGSAQ